MPQTDPVDVITSSPDFDKLVSLLLRLGEQEQVDRELDNSDLAAMCGDRGVLDWTPIRELMASRSVPSG